MEVGNDDRVAVLRSCAVAEGDGPRQGRVAGPLCTLASCAVLLIVGCNPTFGSWPDVVPGDVREDAAADADGAEDADAEDDGAGDADAAGEDAADADGHDDADVGDADVADVCDPEAGCCSALDCNDEVVCTDDLCDPGTRTCSNPLRSAWCRIDGACRSDGEMNPSNPCLECRASADTAAWTDACPGHVTETTFEDFRDGTFPRSAGNLYVSSDGAVRVIRAGDLNGDGWHDIVTTGWGVSGPTYAIDSYVYWGSSSGFSVASRTALPTLAAAAAEVADLNADGWADIVVANNRNESGGQFLESYVYWGSRSGFDPLRRTGLPTRSAYGVGIGDLNADGYLDVVLTTAVTERELSSYVYWGTPVGFLVGSRSELPTQGATGVAIADLNEDTYLDIVFANSGTESTTHVDSYVSSAK